MVPLRHRGWDGLLGLPRAVLKQRLAAAHHGIRARGEARHSCIGVSSLEVPGRNDGCISVRQLDITTAQGA